MLSFFNLLEPHICLLIDKYKMKHLFISLISLFIVKTVSGQPADSYIISWPDDYKPTNSKFFVHNEIAINASPKVVWKYLIDALNWESWYAGAKNVTISDSNVRVLSGNSVFRWKTMGLNLETRVIQYEENRLLAWESKKSSIQGYHVWLIIPSENGCKVITDESQNGWLTFFEKLFQGKKLEKLHGVWLTALKQKAEGNK